MLNEQSVSVIFLMKNDTSLTNWQAYTFVKKKEEKTN